MKSPKFFPSIQWALGTAPALGTVHTGTRLRNHFCNLSWRQSWDLLLLAKFPHHTKDEVKQQKCAKMSTRGWHSLGYCLYDMPYNTEIKSQSKGIVPIQGKSNPAWLAYEPLLELGWHLHHCSSIQQGPLQSTSKVPCRVLLNSNCEQK